MAKTEIQRFKDFKKRNQLTNQKIREVVLDYAHTNCDYSRSYYTQEYEISEYVFYKCRDFAIIFCLVDEATCKRLEKKTAANYKRNNQQESAAQSLKHHAELLHQRNDFLNSFSDNDIVKMAQKYVDGFEISKIAITYDVSELTVKYLLKKGITELILSKSLIKAMEKRFVAKPSSILSMREKNKDQLLKCISAEINFYEFRIKNLGLYERISGQTASRSSIEQQLENAKKMYKEASQL